MKSQEQILITELPKQTEKIIQKLNNLIKTVFPECDEGCNDCLFFNHKFWQGKDRIGECGLAVKAKQKIYEGREDELEWRVAYGKKSKDWVFSKEVLAIPNYCCQLRCYVYRRFKKLPDWRREKQEKLYLKYKRYYDLP